MRLLEHLSEIARCPHCGTAHPTLELAWHSQTMVHRSTEGPRNFWAAYSCTGCGDIVLAKGQDNINDPNAHVQAIFPSPHEAHEDLPPTARKFLQQAYDTLYAPDAAAVMAGSAVDAMLKEKGYGDGSVYARIEQAVKDHLLTEAMGKWAHEVRLGANRPRHADSERPHVSPDEAATAVEFAEALGSFLFVLSAKVVRGIARAKSADQEVPSV